MSKSIFIILLATFIGSSVSSQICGVDTKTQERWMPKYLKNLRHAALDKRSVLVEIPVVFHAVSRSNKAGGVSKIKCLEAICELNEMFLPAAIQFYMDSSGFNQVPNDVVFNTPYISTGKQAMRTYNKPNVLNVFVVNKVSENNALGIYDPDEDWILIQKGAIGKGNKVLAHELGHFFSLLHTHFGWDGRPWTAAYDNKPVSSLSFDGKTPTELVNRLNCSVGGDMLCDTPSDYNFGLNYQNSCTFSGNALDPSGVGVIPNSMLLMSYFSDDCRSSFSEEQILVMRADLNRDERIILYGQIPTDNRQITQIPQTFYPELEVISSFEKDTLNFTWESVDGAAYYYLVIDRSSQFDLEPIEIITTQPSIFIDFPFLENTNYFWKVMPYNQHHTCNSFSAVKSFSLKRTTSSTAIKNDIEFEASYANQMIEIFIRSNHENLSQIWLVNASGQKILQFKDFIVNQENKINLFCPIIPHGVYYLTLVGNHKIVAKNLWVH